MIVHGRKSRISEESSEPGSMKTAERLNWTVGKYAVARRAAMLPSHSLNYRDFMVIHEPQISNHLALRAGRK